MTVGFHAPLPPARTGVADYAAALLGGLRRHGAVEVDAPRADVRLYHLGNNQLHRPIYLRALEEPGVVVLHDAVLHHFFLGAMDRDRYIREFVYNYGEWQRGLAEEFWRARAASGAGERYFRYPMLKRIAERSRAMVVHNAAAARLVRAHAPGARVVEIPHLFEPPPHPPEVAGFRRRHGIREGAFLFGVFGYLRESKRLMAVLRAFAGVPGAALLVAGDFVSSDLARAAAPLLSAPGVVRLPFQRDFWRAAAAVDACINLRYPAAGETSGIAVRLMGLGKPVLLTDAEENAGYPGEACLRVEPGPGEEYSLRAHMILLTSVTGAAREIGRHAADHVAAHHCLESVAARYWKMLCEHRCQPLP